MLLLVTGASGSGKSTAARGLDLPHLSVHDSDEHGVPSDADSAWRQRDLCRWVEHAVHLERAGVDLLLTGQSPLGELLAVPASDRLALAVCLLDVGDDERHRRLRHRDPEAWTPESLRTMDAWAAWHRAHVDDPSHLVEVLTHGADASMRWDRWRTWSSGDPRWAATVVDTTGDRPADTTRALSAWVLASRSGYADETSPLRSGWATSRR